MEPTGETSEARRRTAIESELRRLEESATYSSQMQFEQTKLWRTVNLGLGLPASMLAAVSGATALASTTGRLTAGVLALAAAGFGAVLTTVNASHRMNQAASAANAYLEIQTAARQAREIDLPVLSIEEARATLAELLSLNAWCRHGVSALKVSPVSVSTPSIRWGRYWISRRPRRTALMRWSGSVNAVLASLRRSSDQIPSTGLRSGQ